MLRCAALCVPHTGHLPPRPTPHLVIHRPNLHSQVKCFYGARYDAAPLGHSTGVLVCTCESANSL